VGETVTRGDFERDADKAAANVAKHGVSFEEATTVFASTTIEKSGALYPDRTITIGFSSVSRLLTVVTTETVGDRIRIVNARQATRGERAEFAEEG
jgi:uncharacterized DUF497 family protein